MFVRCHEKFHHQTSSSYFSYRSTLCILGSYRGVKRPIQYLFWQNIYFPKMVLEVWGDGLLKLIKFIFIPILSAYLSIKVSESMTKFSGFICQRSNERTKDEYSVWRKSTTPFNDLLPFDHKTAPIAVENRTSILDAIDLLRKLENRKELYSSKFFVKLY